VLCSVAKFLNSLRTYLGSLSEFCGGVGVVCDGFYAFGGQEFNDQSFYIGAEIGIKISLTKFW